MKEISRETIKRAAGGDIRAFEEIYRAASGLVYSTALRITGNREDANDVTQEVFVKLYEGLSSFEYRSSLKTWIYRIAANAALNRASSMSAVASRRGDFELAVRGRAAGNRAEDLVLWNERERALSRLLDSLPPEQKACIVLREIEGLSYSEIAETLEININTVRTRLLRARSTLAAEARKEREAVGEM